MNKSMLVAVSDIHLGDNAANRLGFVDFIERYLKPNAEEITALYLLGDILDLWKRNSSTVIHDNLDILNSVCNLGFHVYYLVGNHDFIMADENGSALFENPPRNLDGALANMTISATQTATSGKKRFRFIHGHQIDYWYALPFYEAFCRAMCHSGEITSRSNLWKLVEHFSARLSPFVASSVACLSDNVREQIEQKLAGPLQGQHMRKEESAIVELDLLSRLIDFEGLIPLEENKQWRDSLDDEILRFCDSARPLVPKLTSIENLVQIESTGSPEELVNAFLATWRDINRWVSNQSLKSVTSRGDEYLLLQIRRLVAMLTVDLHSDEFLIHGHGHQSHVNEIIQEADTGCWLQHAGSFLVIDRGKPSISSWHLD
jgi:UDP-2,3-diacylglucosamine pyrophosphatase LpxH